MKEERSILSVGRSGRRLTLMDGSTWEIDVGDSTKTLIWLPSARVVVEEETDDKLFPYRISNLDTFGPEVVKARRGY